ncbi:MAG: hypothetical protein QNJ31_05280 [Candidatus Caenarcaniphilales bacterium]|nr:hypothetical protein [Candidatus Caenarcaniphilales bacterium]
MSWFKKIFKSTSELDEFCQAYLDNETTLKAQRECFTSFLSNHLEEDKYKIVQSLDLSNLALVNVSEPFGFNYFLGEIRSVYENKGFSTICVKASAIINSANQIALIILKEFNQKPLGDPLDQLKAFLKDSKFLIIVDNVSSMSTEELQLLLNYLNEVKTLLINNENGDSIKKFVQRPENAIVNISNLSNDRALELALSLLNFRSDLIITSAERSELVELINICNNLPELIFNALAGPQQKRSLPIEKYCKLIKETQKNYLAESPSLNNSGSYQALLNYKISKLPQEIINLLKTAAFLPSCGFTVNDLFVLCRNSFFSKDELNNALHFITYLFGLKINDEYLFRKNNIQLSNSKETDNRVALVYYLPEYLKSFIDKSLISESTQAEEEREINSQLVQRLESNTLWKEPTVWITQLEHSLASIKWIEANGSFEQNKYFILYIQSLFAELGFWREIENTLIPLCSKAISISDNNEERGFWYSLSGIMLKSISQYKDPEKHLDLALVAFQRSLKFYDPYKQSKRYSFVYQNLGLIYLELSELDTNNSVFLKQAIKSFYKSFAEENDPCSKDTISLKRFLSQAYSALAKCEKPSENCFKAVNLTIESLNILKLNIPDDPRIKLLSKELQMLNKLIVSLAEQSSDHESKKLIFLKKQVDDFFKEVSLDKATFSHKDSLQTA